MQKKKKKKKKGNEYSKILKTKNSRTVLLSKYAVCNSKILKQKKQKDY